MQVSEFEDAISSASGVDLKVMAQNSRTFSASMRNHAMGRLSLSEIECDSAVIERPRQVKDSNRYFVMVQLDGTGTIVYGSHQFEMVPGDFFVANSADSYQNIFESRVRRLVIRMERQDLLSRLSQPSNLCGYRVNGETATARVFGRIVRELVAEVSNLDMRARSVLSSSVLDLLALAVKSPDDDPESGAGSRRRAIRDRILAFIGHNLCNPQLDTFLIARELKMSPRYVQAIFERSGTTVREAIRERRLQQCYERLLDRRASDKTISEIAFQAGFNSIEHFCRIFKARYNATPRSVRARQS